MRNNLVGKLVTMLVILTLILALAGCGAGQQDQSQNGTNGKTEKGEDTQDHGEEAKETILKFATYAPLEKGLEPFWTKIKKDYEAQNKHTTIEWVLYPYGELKQQVLVMSAGGNRPDIAYGGRSWLDGFISSGFLAPMNDLFGQDFVNDFYPSVIKDMSDNDGQLYAIPQFISPYVLYYNKELFKAAGLDPDQPPRTYEQALAYAEKLSTLKDKDGNKVYGLGQTTASVPVSGASVLSVMLSFGGGLWDESGHVKVNTPENVEALQFLRKIFEKGYNPEAAKLKDLRNLFAIGRLGMYFDQAWGIGGVFAMNADMKSKVACVGPLATSKTEGLSTLEATILMVFKDTDKEKEAADLIEFIVSDANMEHYVDTVAPMFPARKSQENLDKFVNNPIIKDAVKDANKVKELKKHPEMANVFLDLTSSAQAVTVGNENAEAVLKKLEDSFKTLLK